MRRRQHRQELQLQGRCTRLALVLLLACFASTALGLRVCSSSSASMQGCSSTWRCQQSRSTRPFGRRRRLAVAMSSGEGKEGKASSLDNKTKQEIRREVQSAISDANYQVSSKFMTFQDLTMDAIQSQRGKKRSAPVAPMPRQTSPVPVAVIRAREEAKYQRIKYRLILDNAFATVLGTSGVWGFVGFKAAVSYGVGGVVGTMYLALLGRFVESLGSEGGGAGGGGPARLALVVFLVLLCSKNRETLDLLPALAGFFTYQVSTLLQGLYAGADEEEDARVAAGETSSS